VSDDDFASRVSRLAALAEPARRALYRFVASQSEPVSRDRASEGVGLPRHTAKFHLDRLVEEGLLVTEFRRLTGRTGPGAGRPTKLYRRAPQSVSVSVPERRYDLAGDLMARAIEESATLGTDVSHALNRTAAEYGATLATGVADAAGADATEATRLDGLCASLEALGYEPRLDGDVVTLANCPFHALAREHTELVCGMNLALLTGMAERAWPEVTATLDPAADRCCVTLVDG
jgi:predicted ArsR family transcriptional regulator